MISTYRVCNTGNFLATTLQNDDNWLRKDDFRWKRFQDWNAAKIVHIWRKSQGTIIAPMRCKGQDRQSDTIARRSLSSKQELPTDAILHNIPDFTVLLRASQIRKKMALTVRCRTSLPVHSWRTGNWLVRENKWCSASASENLDTLLLLIILTPVKRVRTPQDSL